MAMADVAPGAPRYTIQDDFATLRVAIPAPRNWLTILFLGFWLMGWAVGEIIVGALFLRGVFAALRGQTPNVGESAGMLFMGVWLLLWTLGGGFALLTWLWGLAGKEIIVVDGEGLTVRRAVFGIGPAKRYAAAYVDRLRLADESGASSGPWGGGLVFDYGDETIRLGAGLNPSEAREVLARIADRFPALTRGLE